MKFWTLLLLTFCTAVVAVAQDEELLPRVKFQYDGDPVDLQPAYGGEDAFYVPLRKAIALFTNNKGQIKKVGDLIEVRLEDKLLMRLPTEDSVQRRAQIFDPQGDPTVPVREYALIEGVWEKKDATFVNIQAISDIFGATIDFDEDQVRLYSPQYWGKELGLGLDKIAQLNINAAPRTPMMGISPPAKNVIFWVRPNEPCFVQVYKFSTGKPEPMIGRHRVLNTPVIRVSDEPLAMYPGDQNHPVRLQSLFYGDTDRYAEYVAVVTKDDLGDKDPVTEINAGRIDPGKWWVVGVRQKVWRSPIRYDIIEAVAGDTSAKIAGRTKMPVSLFLLLNGLASKDPIAEGDPVLVMTGFDEAFIANRDKVDYDVAGLQCVMPGDSLDSLAKKWGVTTKQILQANTSIPVGAEVEPGAVLMRIKPAGGDAPSETGGNLIKLKPGSQLLAKGQIPLYKAPVSSSEVVRQLQDQFILDPIAKTSDGQWYFVGAGIKEGYVQASSVTPKGNLVAETSFTAGGPTDMETRAVRTEALKYLGTPYVWGGGNLTQGIDCSHYVDRVFNRIGWPCPDPPVHDQETVGTVVHWKTAGIIRRRDKTYAVGKPPSWDTLKPGDRMVIQYASGAYGHRHTGIFLGAISGRQFGNKQYAVANARHPGVSVDDLRYGWLIKSYKYCVRDNRKSSGGKNLANNDKKEVLADENSKFIAFESSPDFWDAVVHPDNR